ncbi:MAG TPA: xylulokinase [Candidatus Acidoferrum sp.]|nr:xylulokinase [Candidatus Acidoferrum sp.]
MLGIDVGTGGTRAILIDRDGRVVSSASADHQPFASPQIGWAEQHPDDWWQATCLAVRQALASANLSGKDIACVGFSGQMHGAVLLDEHGSVVRPALIWCDVRTEKQCRDLTKALGLQRLIQLTCNPALPNFTLTKLLWVRENEPENWKRVCHVLLPKDYVRFRLSGDRATDMADASGTLLLDVAHRRWSQEMLDAAALDESLLPAVYESPEVCAKVSAQGATESGLSVGTPVVAGAGDQAAGAVGMGIVSPGTVSATIGTSGVVFAVTDRPALDTRGRVHTFCHAIPGRWHVMGVTQAAGLSLRWFRDTFTIDSNGAPATYDHLTEEAAKIPTGSDGLLWTPYLMGERTPHLDGSARSALVGLTASHTRGHVVRAILEGVAFSLRDTLTLFEEMNVPVNSIRLGGGGARSPLWRQIQADVYGHSVELVAAEEGAAYGAALLAAVGAGVWPSVDAACASAVRVASRVEPQPSAVATLNSSYAAFRRIYPATRQILFSS